MAPPLPAINVADLSHRSLLAPAEYLVTDRDAGLDDVRLGWFTPLSAEALNQGLSDRAYWIRFRVENPADRAKAWVLHHETAYLDRFFVHHADNGQDIRVTRLSDRRPFAERMFAYRKLAFHHRTQARGHTDIYVQLGNEKADSISLGLHLWSEHAFFENVQRENLLHGIYFGAMLALMLLTALSAAILREGIYLHYFVFLSVSTLMWAMLNGFAYQYLWPWSVYWQNEGFHIVYLLVSISALQFSKGFLQTRRIAPRTHHLLSALQLTMAGGILARVLGYYEPVVVFSYLSMCSLGLLPFLGLMAWRRGLTYARWYTLAWLVYSAGLIMSVLSASSSLFSWGMQPLVFAQVGGMLEAMLLFAALGERLLGWDRDRRSALRMATQDPLTGLGNRRLLAPALERFRERLSRTGTPVFLLMIDLDRFKGINDTYGHDAGDAVLRDVADLLLRLSRPEDVCIRYGGEEFAVIFQAPSASAAREVAERIRTEFAASATRHGGNDIAHTLSAGLAEILSPGERLDLDTLVSRADAALYRSKAAGRNRTIVFSPDQGERNGIVQPAHGG